MRALRRLRWQDRQGDRDPVTAIVYGEASGPSGYSVRWDASQVTLCAEAGGVHATIFEGSRATRVLIAPELAIRIATELGRLAREATPVTAAQDRDEPAKLLEVATSDPDPGFDGKCVHCSQTMGIDPASLIAAPRRKSDKYSSAKNHEYRHAPSDACRRKSVARTIGPCACIYRGVYLSRQGEAPDGKRMRR